MMKSAGYVAGLLHVFTFKIWIMLEQKGILPLEGMVGEINFFTLGDGYRMRGKGGVTESRLRPIVRFYAQVRLCGVWNSG